MIWLFVVGINGMTNGEQARYFRKIKGYRHTDRRVKEPREIVVQGVVDKVGKDIMWLGGSFLVDCSETGAQIIFDEVIQCTPTFVRVYECKLMEDFEGLIFAPEIVEVTKNENGK